MTGRAILLVEDDWEQQQLYRLVLASCYQLTVVVDSESALALLERHQFDLVLTDWQLPGINGDRLIAEIHRSRPQIKTILMSTDAQVREIADLTGADGWYRKGNAISQLRAVIAGLLPESPPGTSANGALTAMKRD